MKQIVSNITKWFGIWVATIVVPMCQVVTAQTNKPAELFVSRTIEKPERMTYQEFENLLYDYMASSNQVKMFVISSNPTNSAVTTATELTQRQRVDTEHPLARGENLQYVSKLFWCPLNEIRRMNNLDPAYDRVQEEGKILRVKARGSENVRIHKVSKGDTVWGIGRMYGHAENVILKYNDRSKEDNLTIGDTILLPPKDPNIKAEMESGGVSLSFYQIFRLNGQIYTRYVGE